MCPALFWVLRMQRRTRQRDDGESQAYKVTKPGEILGQISSFVRRET